jgi:hypothetical protein
VESDSLASLSLCNSGYSFVIGLDTGKHDAETAAMVVSSVYKGDESGNAIHRETGFYLARRIPETKPA